MLLMVRLVEGVGVMISGVVVVLRLLFSCGFL